MYKEMDTEALALISEVKFYVNHNFLNTENEKREKARLISQFEKIKEINTLEFKEQVWNDLNRVMLDV